MSVGLRVAAWCLSLCVDVALAQSSQNPLADALPPSPASSTTTLPEVKVEAHRDNGIGTSDAASQGTPLRGGSLQDVPLLRPAEVLESVPGMVVTQHSGDGKAGQYFLRGYNLDHGTDFATSVDGVPVNMPTNAHGQGYSDLNFLIPELVQRINYRKGPYYAENGDFASAGSADIVYRNSLDRSLANLTLGSFDYRRLLLAGSTSLSAPGQGLGSSPAPGSTGPTLLRALEVLQNNGPWALKENLRKTKALVRLSDGNAANGWSLDAVYYDARWNSTDQVPLNLIASGQLGRYSALDPTDGGDTGRQILSGEWHNSDANGYSRISAYLQRYRCGSGRTSPSSSCVRQPGISSNKWKTAISWAVKPSRGGYTGCWAAIP